jgi:GT2 family glycosyltransferase
MKSTSPVIAVIIPTWNLLTDLIECIESVNNSTYKNLITVIIDNNSTDGTAKYIQNNYPEIKLIQNESNLGYAKAINQGIKSARLDDAEYFFILNNDTIIQPNTINSLYNIFLSNKDTGIVAPKVLYFENPEIIFSIGDKVIPPIPIPIGYGYKKKDSNKYSKIFELDYVTGCAMLLSNQTINKVGFFNEQFFMYYEDAEYCYRTRKTKLRIFCNGNSTILHKASLYGRRGNYSIQQLRAKNRIIFFNYHNHGAFSFLTIPIVLFIDFIKIIFFLITNKNISKAKAYSKGIIEGLNTILHNYG